MTWAVVTLALALAGMGVVLALLIRWGMRGIESARNEADVARGLLKLEEARSATLVDERNAIQQRHDVAVSQLVKAKARLAHVEQERNEAFIREREHVEAVAATGDAGAVASVTNELLARPLPAVGSSAQSQSREIAKDRTK